jgi:hypothetical protein
LDAQWAKEEGYFCYDFNNPEAIPAHFHQKFAMVVVDPPFITREVWEKYSVAIKLLLKPDGRIIATTIAENESMMKELLVSPPFSYSLSFCLSYDIFSKLHRV